MGWVPLLAPAKTGVVETVAAPQGPARDMIMITGDQKPRRKLPRENWALFVAIRTRFGCVPIWRRGIS